MQNFLIIPETDTLQASLPKILGNDRTILSQSSGTVFPTTNLEVGMPCFRTDQKKLYVLTVLSPVTWTLVADVNNGVITWTSANDGAGSGLDADTVDGLQASQLFRSDLTTGDSVLGLATISKSIRVLTSWVDTGIKAADLADGTYAFELIANDSAVGGGHSNTTYSGMLHWFSADTNATHADEIILHRSGVSSGANNLYLRTLHTVTADANNLKLQIAADAAASSASTYTFKFRRLI